MLKIDKSLQVYFSSYFPMKKNTLTLSVPVVLDQYYA